VWFDDAGPTDTGQAPKIVKMTTSGTKTEYSLPEGSDLDGIDDLTGRAGKEEALWFTSGEAPFPEYPNRLVRITTSGAVTDYAIALEWPWGIR
jgi:hypothetical protein